MSSLTKFMGGSPIEVAIRLLIISFIVGIILSALNLDPLDILDGIYNLAIRVYEMGWDALGWAFRYLALGAVIVLPIWFVSRLLKMTNRSS